MVSAGAALPLYPIATILSLSTAHWRALRKAGSVSIGWPVDLGYSFLSAQLKPSSSKPIVTALIPVRAASLSRVVNCADGTFQPLWMAPVLRSCAIVSWFWYLSLIHISEPTRLGMISY